MEFSFVFGVQNFHHVCFSINLIQHLLGLFEQSLEFFMNLGKFSFIIHLIFPFFLSSSLTPPGNPVVYWIYLFSLLVTESRVWVLTAPVACEVGAVGVTGQDPLQMVITPMQ